MLINDWYQMYDSILKCINDNNIYSLSTLQKGWISKQKLRYKNKELSDEEINLLTDLGVDFKGSYLFKKKKKKVEKTITEKPNKIKEKDNNEKWELHFNELYNQYEKHNYDLDVTLVLLDEYTKNWLNRNYTLYKNGKIKNKDRIKKLNDMFIDWSFKDTYYLNDTITYYPEYKRTMLERMKHILEDLSYEIDGSINSRDDQEIIEKEIIKRMWR